MRSSLKRAGPIAFVALLALLILPASALATADRPQARRSTARSATRCRSTRCGWSSRRCSSCSCRRASRCSRSASPAAKNAGTGVAKILTNLSIAAICYWAVGFAFAFGSDGRARHLGLDHRARTGSSCSSPGTRVEAIPGDGRLRRDDRGEVPVPVRVLRGVAGDRLGLDAGADQVQRVRDLRDRVRGDHLPDRLALGVRRRLAAERRDAAAADRHAGLRRLDGGPPHRCDRRAGGAAAARPA